MFTMTAQAEAKDLCMDLATYRSPKDNKWYFWTESYDEVGPYESEHLAAISCIEYCHLELDGGFEYQWRKRYGSNLREL